MRRLPCDRWRCIALDHLEKTGFAPHIVALAIDVLARLLACALPHQLPLAVNPLQLAQDEGTNGIEAHVPWGGDAHPPVRRVHAETQTTNVPADQFDRKVTEVKQGRHQQAACQPMIRPPATLTKKQYDMGESVTTITEQVRSAMPGSEADAGPQDPSEWTRIGAVERSTHADALYFR